MEPIVTDVITVMNLGWQYAPSSAHGTPRGALHDVSCYVAEGTLAGIVGPTGSGKSTLAQALTGIIPHILDGTLTGFIRVAGMNVKSTSVSNISAKVGYVPQNPVDLFVTNEVENEIAFPLENRGVAPDEIRSRVGEVLDRLHIEGLRHRDPRTLSEGEMMRVAIGSAIAAGPEVLILDEVLAVLDEDGAQDLYAILDDLMERNHTSVVMIDLDTRWLREHADSVLVMVGGEVIRRTTREVFLREASLLESVGVSRSRDDHTPLTIARLEPQDVTDPIIIFDHVYYLHPHSENSEAPQLHDVNLRIPRGSFVGVVGPNGSGKTTLLSMMNSQILPSRGHVIVDENDTAECRVRRMAREVAYLDQDPLHMMLTRNVRKEIEFAPRALGVPTQEVNERVNALIRAFDLFDIEDADPIRLSTGQTRLVALASTLATQAPILVLDEPVAGLDYRLKTKFMTLVRDLNKQGITVIMASNDDDLVERYCTHALRMEEGRIVDFGPLHSAKSRSLHHDREGRV